MTTTPFRTSGPQAATAAGEALLTEASFRWPAHIVPSPRLEHAPFAFWLMDAMRARTVVELGSDGGFSYMVWCQAAEQAGALAHCYAVDPFGWASGDEVFAAVQRRNTQYYQAFSELVRAPFDEALPQFTDGFIDLLHIDGLRDAEQLRRDFDAWLPKLSCRGVVLIHGTNARDLHAGAAQVWSELAHSHPSFEFFHGGGLGVLAVGPDVPAGIQALFELSEEASVATRKAYARLGYAVALQCESDDTRTALQRKAQSLDDTQRALTSVDAQARASVAELEALKLALAKAVTHANLVDAELRMQQTRVDKLSEEIEEERESLVNADENLRRARDEVTALRSSTSWRVTAPMRGVMRSVPVSRRAVAKLKFLSAITRNSVRENGLTPTLRKSVVALRRRGLRGLLNASAGGGLLAQFDLDPGRPAADCLALRVLIIAELSIPQCRKYRVTQKQTMIQDLGIDCSVVSWTETEKCRSLLDSHSVVIFYRVPGYPAQLEVIEEAKRRGLPTFWEVDDLIFDAEKYSRNSNLTDLDPEILRGLLNGAILYRKAMLACDSGIASTAGLAEAMREAGVPDVLVIENALDEETVRIASRINALTQHEDDVVRIVYGSGTKTHDADFRVAAGAIKQVLRARPNVRLRIAGELNLPADYAEVEAQIERLPLSNYATYLKRLAECDISIAPLEQTIFNDAKSNIKYLEAAIVRLPSVCSPSSAFRTAIQDGVTGFLPANPGAWERALLALIDDAALRKEVADRAYEHVKQDYDPHTVGREQVAPLVKRFERTFAKTRVLGVNIYFAPRSFGGATIVAEEVARCLNRDAEVDYFMFTTLPTSDVPAYQLRRYESTAAGVFAMGLPNESDPSFGFDNPNSVDAFREALRALRPDIVHLHSIQGIGARIAEVCRAERVPFAVTLHDAWWICGRQFMITGENKYCGQRKIDLDVCSACVEDAGLNTYRQYRLREILMQASLLLAPSEFFRRLYADNGFDAARIVVNKNGIMPPRNPAERESTLGRPLRIGYVGGETPIKGSHLIKTALRSLPHKNYELYVVDNVLNLGRQSILPGDWRVPGKLKIVPAYTQETIDSFFSNLDVLLFPTQWKESFGLSVREALIRDVWVIATDAGGVVEDIVAGENGDIIPLEDDGTELARAIGALLANPARLDGYRNQYTAQIRVFDEQAKELAHLFSRVAAEHVAAPASDAAGSARAQASLAVRPS
ncbi:glycosyltransferase involved in cell wall biosynthesis [Paraburkholderia unamae]|uniref:glycosyltransferase n=1 Tax=Paraburkholderia unamae TaxID=219649 RepID=UPI000DC5AA64|nr:glycosyltransferase [Paraburkholderia unamae]RAR60618.1 glycosyltransferase involved in cell wall biosynthesis [Paraburkholderia unamae]